MSDELPRISVVTPSFNQHAYVEATLRSVLDAGYPALEYVVVDGGSTDGSAEIIERHARRLAWSVSEPDGGQYDAINKGFSRTTGEVMAWLNSDDMYFDWTLRTVGAVFAQFPNIEWVCGGVCYLNRLSQVIGTERLDGGISRDLAARGAYRAGLGGYLPQEGMFWRRSLWERSGAKLDLRYRLAADFELWTRFARYATPVSLKSLVAGFRWHPATQRSGRERDRYDDEAREIAAPLGRAPFGWSLMGRRTPSNLLYRLACVRGTSESLEYDVANDKWTHRREPRGRLYRPFVTRRSV